jgi:hypothetical protein
MLKEVLRPRGIERPFEKSTNMFRAGRRVVQLECFSIRDNVFLVSGTHAPPTLRACDPSRSPLTDKGHNAQRVVGPGLANASRHRLDLTFICSRISLHVRCSAKAPLTRCTVTAVVYAPAVAACGGDPLCAFQRHWTSAALALHLPAIRSPSLSAILWSGCLSFHPPSPFPPRVLLHAQLHFTSRRTQEHTRLCLSQNMIDLLHSFPGLRAVLRLYIWQCCRLDMCASSRLSPLPTFHADAPVQNEDDIILHFVSSHTRSRSCIRLSEVR